MRYAWLATALASLLLAANAKATLVTLTPTAVTAGPDGEYYPSVNLINSSGLSGTPGVGDDAFKTHSATSGGENEWVTAGGSINGEQVTFTLAGSYNLVGTYIWNFNQTGIPSRGVGSFTIDISTDGTTFTPLGTTFTLGPGFADEPAQFVSFSALNVQKVRFDIVSSQPGGDIVGLAEVRFADNVPEPSTIMLLGLGGLLLGKRFGKRR